VIIDRQVGRLLSVNVRLPQDLAWLDIPRDADAYICGPASFMAEASAALVGMGCSQPDSDLVLDL
jgi:ferredoxin-NADP reductase